MPNPISFETIDDLEMLWQKLGAISRVSRWARYEGFPSITEKLALLDQANDEALAAVGKTLEEARATLAQASKQSTTSHSML